MSFNDKKLIFSTNLPSTKDIDPALVRKGRCFDILEFTALNRSDAQSVCDIMNIPLDDGENFTISEIFAITKNEMSHSKPKGFGFI
jgi:ATP-dependent 26S proteasome regulatory subunit